MDGSVTLVLLDVRAFLAKNCETGEAKKLFVRVGAAIELNRQMEGAIDSAAELGRKK